MCVHARGYVCVDEQGLLLLMLSLGSFEDILSNGKAGS